MATKVEKLIEQRDWTCLLQELLASIISRLFCLEDVKRFLAVGTTWRSVADSMDHRNLFQYPGVKSQWLIEKRYNRSECKLYHPLLRDTYCRDIPELLGTSIRCSKDGWLLMSRGEFETFFIDPFSKSKIELPDLPEPYNFRGVTFTSNPTCDDCMVFGFKAVGDGYLQISTISRGKKDWNVLKVNNNLSIWPSPCNPVYHNEKFYCLGRHGDLATFDPNEEEWTVLENPQRPCRDIYENYLVECDGVLMSVFVALMGFNIFVFRLDESVMTWEAVDDLEENMLFLSAPTSFAKRKVIERMKNKIYFPRFHEKYNVFYSLDSGKYETFGNNFSREDLNETAEQLACCWIEPVENHCNEEQLEWCHGDSDSGEDESDSSSSDSELESGGNESDS